MSKIENSDLDHIWHHTNHLWEMAKGSNIFITGGTGFFGRWLLESFIDANDRLHLDMHASVLTRNPAIFARKAAHLAKHPAITILDGDIRDYVFPKSEYNYVIHAASETSAQVAREAPLLMLDTIVEWTRRILEFARTHKTQKLLFISSGAVYGKRQTTRNSEECLAAPTISDLDAVYGEGKRIAELLCHIYRTKYDLKIMIARCFSFICPYLPLNAQYAYGNFL